MCSLEKRDGVFILTLSGEGEHRFNPASIDSILSALAHVNENAHLVSALITTNDGKFFSNGLDLQWVSEFSSSRESRSQILGLKYTQLMVAVMELKLPSIAAVCGHASAGGFIFALAHDYRFMRRDRGFLYMSEVDVGISIPPSVMSIIRSKVGSRHLTEVLLGGRKYTAPMAFKAGIVDSVHENSGETLPFPFVDATCAKLRAQGKTCDFIEVVFETMMNGDFCTQIAEGVRNGQSQITAFNKKCPCTHLILNGFSQGAWITGDILAGPGGCSQITTGLDNTSAPGNAIAAALVWGDVMHEANQPYNVLDGAGLQKDGRSADSLARLNRYASVLRSYCAKGDPICANGNDVNQHLNYFELYTDDASTWAVGKLNDAAPLCAASTPTPSASSTVVASSVGVASSTAIASVGVASATAVASSSAAASSSVAALPSYPTSPVHPAPFPVPQLYEPQCVAILKIQYVYV